MTAYTPRHAPVRQRAAEPVSPAVMFFRWLLRTAKRRRAVPEIPVHPSGAATTPPDGFPVLGGGTIAEARARCDAQRHADAMHAGYANAVDRLRREAGLPTVAEMQAMRAASPFPPLDEPLWDEPIPRGPVHDTRLDLTALHYAPDVAYGQVPVARVLEAERLAQGLIA